MFRRILLPVLALGFAAGSTFLARDWLDRRPRSQSTHATALVKPSTKSVLVAAKALGVGEFVQPAAVRWQPWPDVAVPETYFVEGKRTVEEVAGAVLRRPVAEGEPLIDGIIVQPGDRGFLAAVLEPGMRAVSVAVDEAAANAGLIFPGDRVDMLLSQAIGEEGAERRVSETVLRDVRVIAMGRRLRTEESGSGAPSGPAKTATLEVTAAGAEKVALVTELGKLTLSLRSLAVAADDGERPTGASARVTWDSDVSPALRPENQPRTTMTVVRGPETKIVDIRRGAKP
jgi:pilus assembly protein CpaB